ncbi:MAG: hypothetical protein R3288_00065 [Woeseiaceae bacterium]|nr:hypothetical protein [Woeseiaceae bacterium]
MRPLYDEFDDFDFSDSMAVSRILKEQEREERRYASRRFQGPNEDHQYDDEDYGDYQDYDDYEDYNEDEFDNYSGFDSNH